MSILVLLIIITPCFAFGNQIRLFGASPWTEQGSATCCRQILVHALTVNCESHQLLSLIMFSHYFMIVHNKRDANNNKVSLSVKPTQNSLKKEKKKMQYFACLQFPFVAQNGTYFVEITSTLWTEAFQCEYHYSSRVLTPKLNSGP